MTLSNNATTAFLVLLTLNTLHHANSQYCFSQTNGDLFLLSCTLLGDTYSIITNELTGKCNASEQTMRQCDSLVYSGSNRLSYGKDWIKQAICEVTFDTDQPISNCVNNTVHNHTPTHGPSTVILLLMALVATPTIIFSAIHIRNYLTRQNAPNNPDLRTDLLPPTATPTNPAEIDTPRSISPEPSL